tara:strand:+ start:1035 stop:1301 length:267 start_codon:yes stop_codon:yes gene_type:complete
MGQEIQNFIDVSNKIEKFIEDLKKIDNDKVKSLIKALQEEHNKAKKINQELDDDMQFVVKKKQELLCDLNELLCLLNSERDTLNKLKK